MTFATHESPEHLVKVKQNKKAIKALNTFRSTKESAKKRYNEIILKNKNKETSNFIKRCAEPVVWKPFLIVTSLQIVQQFAMMGILNKYVVVIFQDTFQDTFNSSSISTDIMIASDDVTNDIPGLPPPLTLPADDILTINDSEHHYENNTDLAMIEDHCMKPYEPYLGAVLIGIVRLAANLTLSLMVDQHRRRRIYLVSGISTARSKSNGTFAILRSKIAFFTRVWPIVRVLTRHWSI